MDGYTRTPEMTRELSVTMVTVLRAQPTQRMGQIICNAMGWHSGTLFNLFDERLLEALQNYAKSGESGGDQLFSGITDDRLTHAVDLLDQFDRYSAEDSGYQGSPFQANVHEFLQEQGLRS